MQRKESGSNEEVNLKKKKEHKNSNLKKKRSISMREKSDLIEYYMNQKVSEYSQQSLQPKDSEIVQDNNQILPILQCKESSKQQAITKSRLNVELKKQLNLLGIGEEQDAFENSQINQDFAQRPFSSKYLIKKNNQNLSSNHLGRNQLEIKDYKSTSRMNNRHYFQMVSSSTNNSTNGENSQIYPKSLKGFSFVTASNTYFLSNSFAKRENFVLARGTSQQNRFGLDINFSEQLKQQQKNNKKGCNIEQSSDNMRYRYSQEEETNKSILLNKSKDLLQQNSSLSQENINNQKSKDDSERSQFKSKEDSFSSYLVNLPIHHSKKQPYQIPIVEKKNNKQNCSQQVIGSDYIKFQNKMLNGLMPKPTQEEQLQIDSQKEKEGLLKYFDFPKSLNLQENQISKLEQSKLVFQAYLNQRSPKQVAEKMRDQSLLSVLQKVKSQYVNRQSKLQPKNVNSPQSGSNTPLNLEIIEDLQEIEQGACKENLRVYDNQEKIEHQSNQIDNLRAYFGQERYLKQPKLLSDLINQIARENELMNKEKNELNNMSQVIQDSYQAHFLFKRSKSVDRGSIVRQLKKEQFNHQFHQEMQKLKEKERKLLIKDQKLSPAHNLKNKLDNNLQEDFLIQNSSSLDNLNEISKILDIKQQIEQTKVVLPNSSKFVKRSNTNIKQRKKSDQFNLLQGNSIDNLPSLDCKIISSSKIKTRVPTAFRDFHLNSENRQTNDTQEHQEQQEQQINLKQIIDSFHSEYLFSDSSKENLQKQEKKIKKKKKKQRNLQNNINQLIIINNYNTKQSANLIPKQIQDQLNNSFESYKPSSNHLANNKKSFQKSKKFFQNQNIIHINEKSSKSPQKNQFDLQIDPHYLKAQNLKYKMLRQLIQTKQKEMQL